MFSGGGGDEEEEASDVSAKKRAKVMAKNQAKREQESRWDAARVAQNAKPAINEEAFMQKTYQKVLNAANVLPGMSAWKEKQEEKARQTAGVKPHYSISQQNGFPYRFPPHNFSRTPTPFKFNDPKYWNINGEYAARLALNSFQINNPNYFRFDFDNDNWGGIDFPGQTNCSNFLSQIWWQTGIRIPPQGNQIWDGQYLQKTPEGIFPFTNNQTLQDSLYAWYRTPQQQALFSQNHGEFRIVHSNVTGESGILRDQSSFNNILASYPQIFQPGSAVFYYNSNLHPGVPGWQHASMLVDDSRIPTNYFSPSSSSSIARPALVEQDGLFDSNGMPRDIRSLDDTPTTTLTQISIVPAQPIDPSLYNLLPSELPPASLDGKNCHIVQSGGEGNFSLYYCPPSPAIP